MDGVVCDPAVGTAPLKHGAGAKGKREREGTIAGWLISNPVTNREKGKG